MTELKKWLCADSKCLHAKIEIEDYHYQSKYGTIFKGKRMSVFCKKRMRYIRQYLTSCLDYQNTQIIEFWNKEENKNEMV